MPRFDIPEILLPDYIALHARNHPGKAAVIAGDEVVDWGAFDRRLNRIAHALARHGVGRGDKVGILAGNSADAVCAYFGTLRAGAAVASLPTIVTADSLQRMIEDCGARVLIASADHIAKIEDIRSNLKTVSPEGFVAIGEAPDGWTLFDSWLEGCPETPPAVRNAPDDDLCLIYSSGTTGVPKGIVLTHYCRLNHGYTMSAEQGFDSRSVVLVTNALHSNMAWTQLLCAFLQGATAVVMAKFDAAVWCSLVERHRATHCVMVPTQYQAILDVPDLARRDLGSLKTLVTVGSLMREGTKRRLLEAFSCGYYEVYGLTEGFATVVQPQDLPAKIGSVGRPMMGNDIRIVDENGREMPRGSEGEIVGYSPILMKGYHNSPEQTAAMIWREPATGRTFLRSGDIGRLDEDGFLYLLDRKKDMIVSGGYNVFPADLERVLGAHEDVHDVCVIGIPHEKWGETPLAFVVPRAGTTPDLEAMRDWANGRLGKHQRIARVELRETLPRNPAGKIMKNELRRPYWERAEAGS